MDLYNLILEEKDQIKIKAIKNKSNDLKNMLQNNDPKGLEILENYRDKTTFSNMPLSHLKNIYIQISDVIGHSIFEAKSKNLVKDNDKNNIFLKFIKNYPQIKITHKEDNLYFKEYKIYLCILGNNATRRNYLNSIKKEINPKSILIIDGEYMNGESLNTTKQILNHPLSFNGNEFIEWVKQN